jgi:hypothetical protein
MTTSRSALVLVVLLCACLAGSGARAEPTQIEVRVISKGAKFVGTSMGGVAVTLRDADTGELLVQGVTAGGTGDTARIMQTEQRHHAPVSTADAAAFRATLDLAASRRIEVTALGPLAQRQAANSVSSTMWVVPGKHVKGGDGWLLELPGFAVDVLAPPAHQRLHGAPTVPIRANVVMMCGCPIEPGGPWDASRFEVAAVVSRNGAKLREVPMRYAGETSQFAAELAALEPGAYEVLVYAHDPANGNTGLDRTAFVVEPAP